MYKKAIVVDNDFDQKLNSSPGITTFVIMKYSQATLDKLEKIVDEAGYVIRYERGTFQSGYCILEQKKVVVLNKFLQTEGRINTLIDLIPQLDIRPDKLPEDSKKFYTEITSKLQTEKGE